MTIEDAIRYAQLNKAILFTGAGFSRTATNLDNECIYTGDDLLEKLRKFLKLKNDTHSLQQISNYYMDEKGIDSLITLLSKKFTVKKVTESHRVLAKIPWMNIYTTNYDNVIEFASDNTVKPIVLSDPISINDNICVHINGYVERVTHENIGNEIKLTSTSYDSTIDDSSWMKRFRSELRAAASVIFVGYSMPDLDIRRLFTTCNEYREKCIFIDSPMLDIVSEKELQRFGNVYKIGLDAFTREVVEFSKKFVATTQDNTICLSFSRYKYIIGKTNVSDDDFLKLMMYGQYNNALVETQPYLLRRDDMTKVIDSLKAGNIPVIHSGIANGKTMLAKAISNQLSVEFRIFYLNKDSSVFIDELKQISKELPVLIIVENYNLYFDLLKEIATYKTPNIKILLTARTTAHDFFYERLRTIFSSYTITDHQCDYLSQNDLTWIVESFNHYGLWGEYTTRSLDWKVDFLSKNQPDSNKTIIGGQFHSILLFLIRSPDIKRRILDEYVMVMKNKTSCEILNSIVILSAIFGEVSIDDIENIFDTNVLNSDMVRSNHPLRSFVNFDNSEILIYSSALAFFLLSEAEQDNLLKLLIKIHSSYSKIACHDIHYRNLSIQLVRFANVQQILKKGDDYSYVLKYYSEIKGHPARNCDPLFWLQYATACAEAENYEQAERYFATARGCAQSKTRWNTFQIDNREAIFLLKKAIALQDYAQASLLFTKAKNYINKGFVNFGIERIRKPFNPPVLYMDYWITYRESILANPRKLKDFSGAVNNAYRHVCNLPSDVAEHPDIIKCRDILFSLKKEIEKIS